LTRSRQRRGEGKDGGGRRRGLTVRGELARLTRRLVERLDANEWPSAKWRDDPCGFAEVVLGIKLLPHQRVILEALRDYDRLAIASGQKIGKTAVVIIAALWWYCSYPNATVILTARTDFQVNEVMFKQLRHILRGYRKRTGKVLGILGETARSGLTAPDLRSIKGQTVREVEAIQGTSAGDILDPNAKPALLYLVDEASGLSQPIFEAMIGNTFGGGKLVMISNPTRTSGPFFDAFFAHSDLFWTWRIDSEIIARELAHLKLPGIMNASTIAELRDEYGEESPIYRIRVKGEFVLNETGRIVSLDTLIAAQEAWKIRFAQARAAGERLALSARDGRLHIGVDPAGAGGQGDESAFAARRGKIAYPVVTRRGLDGAGHLVELLALIARLADPRELPPIVKVDVEGDVGSEVWGTLNAYLGQLPAGERKPFVLVAIRASQGAEREPLTYGTIRDELWASVARWLRHGGAIAEDGKLAEELHAPEWIGHVSGKQKATPKEELRKAEKLGRSPDRADALALACWEVPALEATDAEQAAALVPRVPVMVGAMPSPAPTLPDPYAVVDRSYSR
jgi:phage terminase large subunit